MLTDNLEEIDFTLVELNDVIAILKFDISQVDGHFCSNDCCEKYPS